MQTRTNLIQLQTQNFMPSSSLKGLSGSNSGWRRKVASTVRITPEQPDGSLPEGERKTVTALFADIKGSMELMEDLDPEEARAIVDPALKLMDGRGPPLRRLHRAVHRRRHLRAVRRALAHEDHPQRARHAALGMQEEMRWCWAKLV
jgi:class 3 adenylate cyclase